MNHLNHNYQKTEACPVSLEQIDIHLVKIYSSTILSILLFSLFTSKQFPIYLITADYIIRVFWGVKYSPLCTFIKKILQVTHIKPRYEDSRRKKIAAQFGLFFSLCISLFYILHLNIAADVVIILFAFAISLDLLFNYCLACKINSLYHRYVKKDEKPQ